MATKKTPNMNLKTCRGFKVKGLNCASSVDEKEFYDSWSPFNTDGKLPYCKKCCDKLYKKYLDAGHGVEGAIYLVCALNNVPYIGDKFRIAMEALQKQTDRGNNVTKVFGMYYGELLKEKTNHENWVDFSRTDTDYRDIATKIQSYEIAKQDVEDLEIIWGKQKEPRDYAILNETFEQDTKDVEFENPTQEYLYRQLSLAKLRKRKVLEQATENETEPDQAVIGKINDEIFKTMDKLKIADFDSNKPKTFSDKTMFKKLLDIDEKNVKDIYKEPTKHFDHNQFIKYQRESTLRPMADMLIGSSEFDITLEDIERYDLE